MPRFQPGIKFCENLTESPFVAAGAGSVFFVVVVAGFAVVVSGFFVVVVVVATVSGFVVVVVVVVVVVTTVVVSAFVVVVATVVSAFVVLVVVVAVVVEAELFSDDVAAFPEQAEIPVITILPLKIAARILFLTARFFEMRTAVYYCVNHIVMVFTEKVNSKTGLSANFVKTITRRLQNAKNRL